MVTVQVEKAHQEHIPAIAANIRDVDRAELWAVACVTPEEALRLSLESSSAAWTAFINGCPFCMLGVSPNNALQGVGIPWLIGTNMLDEPLVAMIFLRRCRRYLREMFRGYVVLENYVDVRNFVAVGWLRWLGFTIYSPQPTGPFGLPFHRFEMARRRLLTMIDDDKRESANIAGQPGMKGE